MVRSGLGLGPWDAFHAGLHRHLGIGIGAASVLAGALIVVGSLPLGVRPGVGTAANMVLIGAFIDLLLPVLPPAPSRPAGSRTTRRPSRSPAGSPGAYIAAGLGKGPRDGLVLALVARTGWPVRRVRTASSSRCSAPAGRSAARSASAPCSSPWPSGPAMQWGLGRWGRAARRPPADRGERVPRALRTRGGGGAGGARLPRGRRRERA
jgi:hypothetical protein